MSKVNLVSRLMLGLEVTGALEESIAAGCAVNNQSHCYKQVGFQY